ncbi:hypothetical protein [Nocardia asteroides]|uniref:hypothetical protein n=1 Tax=Nocardia asteroides TaxID=1824 RepID=UPI001E42F786|nr:hypothetical protein [Nocardia asteroides]UGT60389.1 hypothetical protein LTT61_24820 [Nocardia asteroides]
MTEDFIVSIAEVATGITLASAKLGVGDGEVRSLEVRAVAGRLPVLPEALESADFKLIVQMARMLADLKQSEARSVAAEAPVPSEPSSVVCAAEIPAEDVVPAEPTMDSPSVLQNEDRANPNAVDNGTDSQPNSEPSKRRPSHSSTDMPSDFGVNYWRLGSITKVARHYDVPHHIAKQWIASLSQEARLETAKAMLSTRESNDQLVIPERGLAVADRLGAGNGSQDVRVMRDFAEQKRRQVTCPTCGTRPSAGYGKLQLSSDIEFRWFELDTSTDNAGGLIVTRHCVACQPAVRFPVSCAFQSCEEGPILGGQLAEDAHSSGGRVPETVIRLLLRRGWAAEGEVLLCPQHIGSSGRV